MEKHRVILVGTQRLVPPQRDRIAPVRSDKKITVTLTLRKKEGSGLVLRRSPAIVPAKRRKHLTAAQAIGAFSRARKDEAAIRRFAREYNLQCSTSASAPTSIDLRGTARQLNQAFGVRLCHYRESKYESKYRGHEEEVTLPAYLEKVGTGVFGLDTHPAGRRPGLSHRMAALGIAPPPVTVKTRKPAEFAPLYKFPTMFTGRGQSIGLLEFGGGFRSRELNSYFKSAGIGAPTIVVKEIPPAANRPRGKRGTLNPDTEVYLDIEVAASLAPKATVVVYFGENTEQGWLRTLQAAIFDKTHDLSVISISWGQAEQDWSHRAVAEIDRLFQLAAYRGITICCSSGDNGINELDGHPFTVAFPASSPHVLACGGTRLEVKRNGSRAETVWNQWRQYKLASGGGVSDIFPLPAYQKTVKMLLSPSHKPKPGRGIPDVAANADSDTGYLIEADKTRMSMGGTSAVAPLWAALIARLNEALGTKIGFITPLLYELRHATPKAVCDIVKGFNGPTRALGYRARHGWDACTGLGSPNGEKLLAWLASRNNKKR
ncbi:MAG TPA: S53 family peptidase [Pyrinomonadaceae bacterium]|nr:S53 family peptidase [Pyrinomonadaceae bacterium]